MRLAAVMIGAVALAASWTNQARAEGMTPAQHRQAFEEASRCVVVLGYASRERRDHNDADRAAYYDAKARDAFQAAVAGGRLSGRSSSEVEGDLKQVADRELPKIVGDTAYFRAAATRCKAIGYL